MDESMTPKPEKEVALHINPQSSVLPVSSKSIADNETQTERQQAAALVNQLLSRSDLDTSDRDRLLALQITLSNE